MPSSKKDCSPACACLVKKGEPTLEEWEEILTSAVSVFSSGFEETTLPDLRRQATEADVFGVCGRLNTSGFRVELRELYAKQGEFYDLGLASPQSLKEIKNRTVGWGILRSRQVVEVTLTVCPDRLRYYFGLEETTISQLIIIPGVKPSRLLWSMRSSAIGQVEWMEHRLKFAQGRFDYLDDALAIVSAATALPSKS